MGVNDDEQGNDERAPYALHAKKLLKHYPGTKALDNVDLAVRQGEILALCGGNGSGKSTLIKILCGVVAADGGTVEINGQLLDAKAIKPMEMRALGLCVVHQDLAVFPDLSVTENMMMGRGYPVTAGRIRWNAARRHTAEQLERFEVPARPEDLVRDLPVGVRAQVAIARALQDVTGSPGVIVLDEPTASLPSHEVELLLDAMRRLAAAGHAIIFVSHRLDEVLSVSDKVIVLSDGRVAAHHDSHGLTESDLIESMVGSALSQQRSARTIPASAPAALTLDGVAAGPLKNIDLVVRRGEVVGVAGLLGSGRTELLLTIAGELKRTAGTVELNGQPANFKRIEQAITAGVILVPENRVEQAIFPGLSLDANLDVSALPRYRRFFGFDRKAMDRDNADLRKKFRIKAPDGKGDIISLSGGNQQKVVIGRWFRRNPSLLLLDEPTQGVDVGARADIYQAVRDVVDGGGAAIVVSSDFEELALYTDRTVVLSDGRIVAEFAGDDMTAHRLNEAIYTQHAHQ